MRIAIDARVIDGDPGGVQQAVLGLASGLATLVDSDDEYLFLVYPDHEWLRPALRGPCKPLVGGSAGDAKSARMRQLAGSSPLLGKIIDYAADSRGHVLPASDGTVEAADVDLVHFMRQRGFRTRLPNIYQPHDLQHVHHPEFWHPLTRAYRRVMYRAMARQASLVAVMTAGGRDDVIRHLGVDPARVIVVPWASILSLYAEAYGTSAAASPRLGLPERFLLFPAQTWPHKNHLRLIQAIARLRARWNLDVALVLTGRKNEHWPAVAAEIRRLAVDDLVHPLGFVDAGTLRQLYLRASGVVFPSLFEGWGLPILEAFEAGTAVVCSDISPLREIARGGALTFNPYNVDAIAEAVATVWTNAAVRQRLVDAGHARHREFSWGRTARIFRAHYRALLGVSRTPEDDALLATPCATELGSAENVRKA
ncbi:MAG TPA: glycosyltransferase family 1 protein [Egibacteraceae bacterium]|jgi:glycosyltransferase involved in cell wall biosynthesis|nr:glycosyltransferase family 1 protein [Egibacteraceae bacterium]